MFPLVLGKGKRLFEDGVAPTGLKVEEARPFSTGVTLHRYRPAGKPAYGSFLNHNPPPVELERRRRFAESPA